MTSNDMTRTRSPLNWPAFDLFEVTILPSQDVYVTMKCGTRGANLSGFWGVTRNLKKMVQKLRPGRRNFGKELYGKEKKTGVT